KLLFKLLLQLVRCANALDSEPNDPQKPSSTSDSQQQQEKEKEKEKDLGMTTLVPEHLSPDICGKYQGLFRGAGLDEVVESGLNVLSRLENHGSSPGHVDNLHVDEAHVDSGDVDTAASVTPPNEVADAVAGAASNVTSSDEGGSKSVCAPPKPVEEQVVEWSYKAASLLLRKYKELELFKKMVEKSA
ncbi:unnamed protein product, partial [Closterium sp. Naga37s-1]